VAFLGCGFITEVHSRHLRSLRDLWRPSYASRDGAGAVELRNRFSGRRAYDGYADALADPEVDAVVVAVPPRWHLELTLAALEAGKHVLVEKPIAVTADEAEQIAAAARAAGVFAGEAMWTRYLPQFAVLRQVLDRGDLGAIRLATADVGWAAGPDPAPRFTDPALGGGAALDMGVYGYWFAQFAIGRPVDVLAVGTRLDTGVEDQTVAALRGADGGLASVTTTMAVSNSGLASVRGTAGEARFLDPFVFPARFLVRVGGFEHVWNDASGLVLREGLAWQTTAIARMITDGLTDSPLHPLDDAVAVLRTIDAVRAQVAAGPREPPHDPRGPQR
jgi:predicted dehydrogenase